MIQNGTAMRSLVYTDDEMKKKEDMIRTAYREGEISYDEMISAIHDGWRPAKNRRMLHVFATT